MSISKNPVTWLVTPFKDGSVATNLYTTKQVKFAGPNHRKAADKFVSLVQAQENHRVAIATVERAYPDVVITSA